MKLHNDLLLRTARGERVERPPVWLMRQAGRILPQYRALRERLSGFKELVETPDLAAEVTVQPVDELGVDAAILFSDILVIPEAMGLPYTMVEKKGPRFPKTIESAEDVRRLRAGADAAENLQYVYQAVGETLGRLGGRVPLIGFSGAPWTLLAYMVEGQGSKTFSKAKRLLYQQPALAHQLLDKITESIIAYLLAKAEAGVHLVQVFDSWAGMLGPEQFQTFAAPYLQRIAAALQPHVPVTVFAKGAWYALDELTRMPVNVVGLDWTADPASVRRQWPGAVLQGNLDPCQLYADPEEVGRQTRRMIQAFGDRHIANLGHGVYPDTPLASVRAFVDTVKNHAYPDAAG